MINLPLNFSAPTGQVQNTYAAPRRTNPYLTSSQYEGMQLHTPSGLFYQGGTVYEPYTPPRPTYNPFGFGGYSPFNEYSRNQSSPFNGYSPFGTLNQTPEETLKIIKIGDKSFRQFTGDAQGIIDGNLSMVSLLNQQPTYQPKPMEDLFPSLNSNLNSALPQQQMLSSPSYGAGRFTGLLNSPIVTTNTQGK